MDLVAIRTRKCLTKRHLEYAINIAFRFSTIDPAPVAAALPNSLFSLLLAHPANAAIESIKQKTITEHLNFIATPFLSQSKTMGSKIQSKALKQTTPPLKIERV